MRGMAAIVASATDPETTPRVTMWLRVAAKGLMMLESMALALFVSDTPPGEHERCTHLLVADGEDGRSLHCEVAGALRLVVEKANMDESLVVSPNAETP
ncbi:hypothetical protein NDU88_003218 [Pleurodeles waltl]|uniref:Uncharacterized protein n=1 Tax=Pleurodeles waltl TaxID=8319 RepID=A0AAV7W1I1_PLEWA|nr:hypothetical protein NDU88_003218 [Pleurodeles waltl]